MSSTQMPLQKIAEELDLPKSTLSYYSSLGLIKPVAKFPESKLYLYDINDIKRALRSIADLKKRGYKLQDMPSKINIR